jgi:hypothetical protein
VYSFICFFLKYLLTSSGVLFSQLLKEHNNLAAVVVVTAGALQSEARICRILLTSSCFELGPWGNDGSALACSFFIVSKKVRKGGPFKLNKPNCAKSSGFAVTY